MGNCSIIIMLHSAVDVRFYDWRSALHDLAGIHTALPGICCAPVHPGAPGRQFKQTHLLNSLVNLVSVLNFSFLKTTLAKALLAEHTAPPSLIRDSSTV